MLSSVQAKRNHGPGIHEMCLLPRRRSSLRYLCHTGSLGVVSLRILPDLSFMLDTHITRPRHSYVVKRQLATWVKNLLLVECVSLATL